MKTRNTSLIQQCTVAFMLVGSLGVGSSATAQNLVDLTHGAGAGSFELGLYVEDSPGFMRLPSGSTTITGWTVGGSSGVDWLDQPLHRAQEGTKSVDITGLNGGVGSLTTTLPTVVGQQYLLTFFAYGGSENQSGKVSAGDLVGQLFSPSGVPDPSNATYSAFAFSFTAVSATTSLQFETESSDGFGPVIDNVSVTAVPAPGALLTGLVGFIPGVFSLRRPNRRRVRVTSA